MTTILLLIFYALFLTALFYLSLKMDGTKIRISPLRQRKYGLIRAVLLPIQRNIAVTVVFLWVLRVELSTKYPNVKETRHFKEFFEQF